MFSDFAYKYDFSGLYAYRVDILAPQLADLATIVGVCAMAAVYLALYWKVLPYAHYYRAVLADIGERHRKLNAAQDMILTMEIQGELEEEMKDELSREAAQKMGSRVVA